MQVYWCTRAGHRYAMMEVRRRELLYIRERSPALLGIPQYWARMEDGDVEWYPSILDGAPEVVLDPFELERCK